MPTNSYAIRFGQLRICAHLQVGSRFELEYIICLAFTLLEKETFFFLFCRIERSGESKSIDDRYTQENTQWKQGTNIVGLAVCLSFHYCLFRLSRGLSQISMCTTWRKSYSSAYLYKKKKKKQNGLTRVWPLNSLLAHVYDVSNSKPAANTKIGNFSFSTHTLYTRKDEFRKDLIEKNGWYLFAKRWTKKQKTENNR